MSLSRKIKDALQSKIIAEGVVIVREGDRGNVAYLIKSGKVGVYVNAASQERVEVATMGPGQIFGEMSLLNDEPRAATVVALEDTAVILITREMLQQKLTRSDPTIRVLTGMLMKRLAAANKAVLSRGDDLDDLTQTAYHIYENVYASLPPQDRKLLEKSVMPEMKNFLAAIDAFQKTRMRDASGS